MDLSPFLLSTSCLECCPELVTMADSSYWCFLFVERLLAPPACLKGKVFLCLLSCFQTLPSDHFLKIKPCDRGELPFCRDSAVLGLIFQTEVKKEEDLRRRHPVARLRVVLAVRIKILGGRLTSPFLEERLHGRRGGCPGRYLKARSPKETSGLVPRHSSGACQGSPSLWGQLHGIGS